jgi:phosphate transport system protein
MSPRTSFDRLLNQLQSDILTMAQMVDEEMSAAIAALYEKDVVQAQNIFALDDRVNAMRYQVERTALLLISTQQPVARDARALLAALFINVILERMGDKAKSIAKAIPHILLRPGLTIPDELREMAELGQVMLRDGMRAYATEDALLANEIANRDDEVDQLYGETFFSILVRMAKTKKTDKVEAIYELIRIARDLERFADYATDIAERVDFMVTGQLAEINVEDWEDVRASMAAEKSREQRANKL